MYCSINRWATFVREKHFETKKGVGGWESSLSPPSSHSIIPNFDNEHSLVNSHSSFLYVHVLILNSYSGLISPHGLAAFLQATIKIIFHLALPKVYTFQYRISHYKFKLLLQSHTSTGHPEYTNSTHFSHKQEINILHTP